LQRDQISTKRVHHPLMWLLSEELATAAGLLASLCFTAQYLPQAWLNFSKKSVKGFSSLGIILKHVGASFLLVNAILIHENLPVVVYGGVNVLQHSVFLIQFDLYGQLGARVLLWLLFPLVPVVLFTVLPFSVHYTNTIKPITQILSHLPQLEECYRQSSTSGVSKLSQHLNFTGGLLGLYMCWILPPVSPMTYLIYFNSVLQALSLYAFVVYFDMGLFRRSPDPPAKSEASLV